MLFDLLCKCGEISEHMMMSDEIDKEVECPACGEMITRRDNRVYTPPMISGDTCSGCHNFSNYYDHDLGEYVTGRKHRKEIMERKGLIDYSPDPVAKAHRDEARYIRNNAPPGDVAAMAAARKELKTAADKRRTKLVNESLNRSYRKMEAQ